MNRASSGSGGSAISSLLRAARYSALRELRGSGLPPCASGNTHMASTANTAKPITNQNRCGLPLAFSQ